MCRVFCVSKGNTMAVNCHPGPQKHRTHPSQCWRPPATAIVFFFSFSTICKRYIHLREETRLIISTCYCSTRICNTKSRHNTQKYFATFYKRACTLFILYLLIYLTYYLSTSTTYYRIISTPGARHDLHSIVQYINIPKVMLRVHSCSSQKPCQIWQKFTPFLVIFTILRLQNHSPIRSTCYIIFYRYWVSHISLPIYHRLVYCKKTIISYGKTYANSLNKYLVAYPLVPCGTLCYFTIYRLYQTAIYSQTITYGSVNQISS
ncbi:hypothetical protein [Pacific flying fox faeces associated circular DNA virus-9]|nr:hypothetical protein [Pacific flying fox faeces associated circular DNA virus-9]